MKVMISELGKIYIAFVDPSLDGKVITHQII